MTPYSQYLKNVLLNILINLLHFFYTDRIRPACLPLSKAALDARLLSLEMYRLARKNSFNTLQPSEFKAIKYFEIPCQQLSDPSESENLFCASTESNESGNSGDPFIFSFNETGVYPVYQIGIDAFGSNTRSAAFQLLDPYIEWINATIGGNTEQTKNKIIYPMLRDGE